MATEDNAQHVDGTSDLESMSTPYLWIRLVLPWKVPEKYRFTQPRIESFVVQELVYVQSSKIFIYEGGGDPGTGPLSKSI